MRKFFVFTCLAAGFVSCSHIFEEHSSKYSASAWVTRNCPDGSINSLNIVPEVIEINGFSTENASVVLCGYGEFDDNAELSSVKVENLPDNAFYSVNEGGIGIAVIKFYTEPGVKAGVYKPSITMSIYKKSTGTLSKTIKKEISLKINDVNGVLDPTFNKGMLDDIGWKPGDGIMAMAIQTGDAIIIGGDHPSTRNGFQLSRIKNDGSIDTSFGFMGIASAFDSYDHVYLHSLALQSDDKIVATGHYIRNWADPDEKYYVFVAKFLQNGQLDSSFGINGQLLIDVSRAPDELYAGGQDLTIKEGASVGFIPIPATADIYIAGYLETKFSTIENFVIKLNKNGERINTFGSTGILYFGPAAIGNLTKFQSIEVDPSNKDNLIIYGINTDMVNNGHVLIKLKSDGTILKQSSLRHSVTGVNLLASDLTKDGLAIMGDGRIITSRDAEFTPTTSGVFGTFQARFNPDFSKDTTFNMPIGALWADKPRNVDILLQKDNKTVDFGCFEDEIVLTRRNSDGSLDGGFGLNGRAKANKGTITAFCDGDAQLDSKGRIVIATGSLVARYLP